MIIVDTSIWIDHFRQNDPLLDELLRRERAALHPFVVGELAMGTLRDRARTLHLLAQAPFVAPATHEMVLALVERESLYGAGLSFIDAHLVAAVLGAKGASLWTRDKRLALAAERLGLSAVLPLPH